MNKEDNLKEKFKQALISTIKVISEDFKINKKTCIMKGKDWEENISKQKSPGHKMNQADCFQYYNPTIKDYIASRIK